MRVLICAPLMPEFDKEGGSGRILHLIESFQQIGASVTFYAENMTGGERYAHLLRQRKIMVFGGVHSKGIASDAYVPRLEKLFEYTHYDLAVVAFWTLAESLIPVIRRCAPQTRIIVESIDMHFLRMSRRTFTNQDSSDGLNRLTEEYGADMVRELNAYKAADGIFTVSQKEADLINDLLASSEHAHAVPDREDLPTSSISLEERRGILFVGNFRHNPNIAAVKYLFSQIVPELDPALFADHPLYVVGNGLDENVAELIPNLPNIKKVGWVPTLLPYYHRVRVSIVPLLHGAGTKRKVIESLSAGTPCVSTSIGAEGLDLVHEDHMWIADEPAKFATGIVRVLNDDVLWHRLAEKGRDHITATHGDEAINASLHSAIEAVLH